MADLYAGAVLQGRKFCVGECARGRLQVEGFGRVSSAGWFEDGGRVGEVVLVGEGADDVGVSNA